MRRREARLPDSPQHEVPGHPVHRRIDHVQRGPENSARRPGPPNHRPPRHRSPRYRSRRHGDDRVEVRLGHLVAVPDDQRARGLGDRNLCQRPDAGDPLLDLGIDGRYHLGAVAQVELVPVVGRRVVARGDHHAGRRAQLPDREREQGSGARPRQQVHRDTRSGQHPRHLVSEVRRPVPRVAPHHDARLTSIHARSTGVRASLRSKQPARHRRGRGPDHGTVHPVWPCGDRPAQARRPEPKPPGEPIPQFSSSIRRPRVARPPHAAASPGKGAIKQRLQLFPVARIGVISDPGLDRSP